MLHSNIFAPVRGLSSAFLAKEKIHLELDQDDAFDYEAGKSLKFVKAEYLAMY